MGESKISHKTRMMILSTSTGNLRVTGCMLDVENAFSISDIWKWVKTWIKTWSRVTRKSCDHIPVVIHRVTGSVHVSHHGSLHHRR